MTISQQLEHQKLDFYTFIHAVCLEKEYVCSQFFKIAPLFQFSIKCAGNAGT